MGTRPAELRRRSAAKVQKPVPIETSALLDSKRFRHLSVLAQQRIDAMDWQRKLRLK